VGAAGDGFLALVAGPESGTLAGGAARGVDAGAAVVAGRAPARQGRLARRPFGIIPYRALRCACTHSGADGIRGRANGGGDGGRGRD
jgi:hypothetical protein